MERSADTRRNLGNIFNTNKKWSSFGPERQVCILQNPQKTDAFRAKIRHPTFTEFYCRILKKMSPKWTFMDNKVQVLYMQLFVFSGLFNGLLAYAG